MKTKREANALLRERYITKSVSVQNPIAVVRAEGAKLWDEEGREYIDFAGGIGVMNVGHSHPEVIAAIKDQADRLFHTCFHVTMNEPYLQLAEQLCRIAPIAGDKKALLVNTGAEAVENAVKIARSFTGRSALIAFEGAFHGRTMLGISLTSKVNPYKTGFGPFVPEIYRMPFPNPYRSELAGQDLGKQAVETIVQAFETYVDANQVAAVIVEPVQGEGGFIVPPPNFFPLLRNVCRERGIVFILDEVQSGFARTGKMFAAEHYEALDPDLILVAKSLGAGLPIAAVVGKADIMDAPPVGSLGGTYGGNPLAAAGALKVIEVMEREQLPARAETLGQQCVSFLRELQKQSTIIGDVRGQGAMIAIELVKDRETKEPYSEATALVTKKCLEYGLITVKAGVYSNVIRLLFPLVISEDLLRQGLQVIARAVKEAEEELR
ncbi:4-aminobutyrate aminotransferase [Ferroacidibacillus organovorans]|uniref:(S)-3-amino-2-methylpropionate transaminase n=2 Tax=Ferroacidibacillus organovorans TaxID=1765683 RepID=A0A117SYQ7_9BACL|nr:4-aminobutyrate aminotransferase [Ferroacidibacillus organovorans]